MIDFPQSYYTWLTHENSYGRFNIESICNIYDNKDNQIDTIYSLSGVMACDVYGKSPLFYSPSFFYQPIFSKSHVKTFRSFLPHQGKDSVQKIDEKFSRVNPYISFIEKKKVISLNTMEEIHCNLIENNPFFAQIRFNRS